MDITVSRGGKWALRALFAFFVVFLYLPLLRLVVFPFHDVPGGSCAHAGSTLKGFCDCAEIAMARTTHTRTEVMSANGRELMGYSLTHHQNGRQQRIADAPSCAQRAGGGAG